MIRKLTTPLGLDCSDSNMLILDIQWSCPNKIKHTSINSMFVCYNPKSRPYGQSTSCYQLIGQVDAKLGTSLDSKL